MSAGLNLESSLTEEIKGKFTDALEKLNPDNPLEMVFDYVRIRFPTQDVKHVVEDILKLRLDVMIHEDFGSTPMRNIMSWVMCSC